MNIPHKFHPTLFEPAKAHNKKVWNGFLRTSQKSSCCTRKTAQVDYLHIILKLIFLTVIRFIWISFFCYIYTWILAATRSVSPSFCRNQPFVEAATKKPHKLTSSRNASTTIFDRPDIIIAISLRNIWDLSTIYKIYLKIYLL